MRWITLFILLTIIAYYFYKAHYWEYNYYYAKDCFTSIPADTWARVEQDAVYLCFTK